MIQRPARRLPQLRQPYRRLVHWSRIIWGLVLAAGIGGIAIMSFWPGAAAQNIDRLRDIIGDAPVAQLETAALNLQDHAQQLEYQVGLVKPAAPWSDSNPAAPNVASVPTPLPAGSPTAPLPSPTALPDSATPTPLPSPTPLVDSATESPSPTPLADSATEPPSPSVTPLADSSPAWSLPPLAPLGNVPGSGQWSPYLRAADGVTVVAYRTFLNPDPGRPYATAAIVAFDLGATHLHFVLGSVEPWSGAPQPSRTGMIPAADLRAGVLLATFNGGFKARHGHWGAMADGITALPPIDRAATVAMYGGGSVRIGEWGTDIVMSDAMAAWRQNGYLLIHNTLISPDTTQTTSTWGLTIDWKAITWRSALGQSADRRVLYYVAGPELDVNTLTTVMAETGAADALELDVNNFWVNFAAIRGDGPNLAAEPLLPQMTAKVDRYLSASARDFFYVTAGSQQQRP